MEIFSARLKWLRERANLTQKEVADYVGMSPQGYGKIENGHRDPNLEVLSCLPSLFGETVDFMIGVTGDTEEIKELKKEFKRLSTIIHYGQENILNPSRHETELLVGYEEIVAHNIEHRATIEALIKHTTSQVPYYNFKPIPKGSRNQTFD